jgi:hypothetical protein
MTAVARALESVLESRVQANLYCSSRERQAFPSHFDSHDVYALHVEGEKLWRIYRGRLDNPVAHPAFQGQPQAFHEQAKGEIAAEILLKPGDLLYIPRGLYHDAIAQTDGTVHIAFGAVAVIGLDFVSALFERAVHESVFRRDLPRRHTPGGESAFEQHMQNLASALTTIVSDRAMLDSFREFQDRYRYPRGGFELASAAFCNTLIASPVATLRCCVMAMSGCCARPTKPLPFRRVSIAPWNGSSSKRISPPIPLPQPIRRSTRLKKPNFCEPWKPWASSSVGQGFKG